MKQHDAAIEAGHWLDECWAAGEMWGAKCKSGADLPSNTDL